MAGKAERSIRFGKSAVKEPEGVSRAAAVPQGVKDLFPLSFLWRITKAQSVLTVAHQYFYFKVTDTETDRDMVYQQQHD
jgi:hypothetical protein